MTTSTGLAVQEDRDADFSTGMTDGMEMSYPLLDGVPAGQTTSRIHSCRQRGAS